MNAGILAPITQAVEATVQHQEASHCRPYEVSIAQQACRGGALSRQQIAEFSERGYLFPVPVMSMEQAEELLAQLRASEREHGAGLAGIAQCHLTLPWAQALTRDPRILDPVESLIGSDIACCGGQFFIKEPRAPTFVSWHQDGAYWGELGRHIVTAWLALTPSVRENGCLRVLRDRRAALLRHVETFAPHNLLSRGQVADVAIEPTQTVDIVLAPGEMSLHDALIVHGSVANGGAAARIGFAMRFAPGRIAAQGLGIGVTRVRSPSRVLKNVASGAQPGAPGAQEP